MIFTYVSFLSISVLAKYSQVLVDQVINVWNWLSPTVDFSFLSVHVSLLSCSMFCGFLARIAELIKYQISSEVKMLSCVACVCVCLDFNPAHRDLVCADLLTHEHWSHTKI